MPAESRSGNLGYYVLLATSIIAPLAFWPSPYVSLDLVKTALVSIGVLISAVLFGISCLSQAPVTLPKKNLFWTSLLVMLSMIVSSILSVHFGKSFFGQGFEISTTYFSIVLFLSGLLAFFSVYRKQERAISFYLVIATAFLVLLVIQILRIIFGPEFATFSIMSSSSVASSILGSWTSFGMLAMLMAIISVCALALLKLSPKIRSLYWVLTLVSAATIFLVNDGRIWAVGALAFLGLSAYMTKSRFGFKEGGFMSKIAWMPAIAFVISAFLFFTSPVIAKPAIDYVKANYGELNLPWQITLDVTSSVIKNDPLFGVGPNTFNKAYLAYKPLEVNQTEAWSYEFGNGFGLIPTFISGQGLVGTILWVLLFVFYGLLGAKVLSKIRSNVSSGSSSSFIIFSSFFGSVFLWLMAIVSIPAHVLVFFAFVFTGIFLGFSAKEGLSDAFVIQKPAGKLGLITIGSYIVVVIFVLGALISAKNAVAMSYFGSGIKALTVNGDASGADAKFSKALFFDKSDIFYQAMAEAQLSKATALVSSASKNMSAASSTELARQVTDIINTALAYSQKAVEYDPTNYYNYMSQARISEAAASLKMDKAYDSAVSAYGKAIGVNPLNPSIYLSLARFQAGQEKYDEALKSLGSALQLKNNYLDAVFLLSQVEASKGDLTSAINAAKFAAEINPQDPVIFFQLGLLNYNAKSYSESVDALKSALKLQSDYANAQYFLGLAYARLGNYSEATKQFETLASANPDNTEIADILKNLRAGKSPFADAKATVAPEKRSALPVKEKRK